MRTRRVGNLPGLVAKPGDIFEDAVEELLLFLLRVRVVVPQVAVAAGDLCKAKVEVDGLCVSNVQDAIGLRREARVYLAVAGDAQGVQQCTVSRGACRTREGAPRIGTAPSATKD